MTVGAIVILILGLSALKLILKKKNLDFQDDSSNYQ
jgi:hypothetical protein